MAGQEPHSAPGKPGGWRGRKSPAASGWSAAAKGAGWAQRPDRSAESATRWHRLKVGWWLLLAVALIAGFLIYLMYRPMRTPLLMAAATHYAPPWPPNAWAKEDLQGLTVLDRQEVATCQQLPWESNERGSAATPRPTGCRPPRRSRQGCRDRLSEHPRRGGRPGPAVSDPARRGDRRPVSGFPSANCCRRCSWKTALAVVPDHVRKLLVLDAGRVHSNWGAGVLYNAFAERLSEVVA